MTFFPSRRIAAAIGLALSLTQPAFAFSQIGSKDGAAPQREGIVSVPLPPLAGTAAPGSPPAVETRQTPVDPGVGAPAPADDATPSPAGDAPATPPPAAASPAPAAEPPPGAGVSSPGEQPDAPAEDAAPDDAVEPAEDSAPRTDLPAGAATLASEDADNGPPPTIVYGDEGLPKPVRDLRETLMTIAKAGDIEALRPYIQLGEEGTLVSFGGAEGDPIAFLKSASGDGEGVEILAILLEVLEAGHVRNEPDSENEIFVWPYFTAVAIDKLTKPQKVELFELVTAGDYQEMLGFGAYNFYRLGISPDGKLQFFVAGD